MNKIPALNKKTNGITLIELLIAISLLTLIIFAGSGIYLSGWNMFRQAQSMAQAQRNAMIPMAHMVKNIKDGASALYLSAEAPKFTFFIYGNPPNFGTRPPDQIAYLHSGTNIIYEISIATGHWQFYTIGNHIQDFVLSSDHNNNILNVTITATDNNGNNPYTLTSRIRASYTSIPSIYEVI